MEQAGNERLVGQALLDRALLNGLEVLAGNADIQAAVFAKRGSGVAGVAIPLLLCALRRAPLATFKGVTNFFFVAIKLHDLQSPRPSTHGAARYRRPFRLTCNTHSAARYCRPFCAGDYYLVRLQLQLQSRSFMHAASKDLNHNAESRARGIRSAQIVVPCADLQATLDFFIERLRFRLDVIFPADAPSTALISGHGVALRLELANDNAAPPKLRLLCDPAVLVPGTPCELQAPSGMKIEFVDANPAIAVPEGRQEFVINRLSGSGAWGTGRATMQYRDLIPSRLGGRFVASHIRIPEGGPVPDYVHYHRVRFQMIFCKAGWVKVVYEDQGQPFVMRAGDCVLQPPEIRHQVLEASPGLEVIEIGCPAVHETFADHDLRLPNERVDPDRLFSGQRFARHIANQAKWSLWRIEGFEARDTGIAMATKGLADVRLVRSSGAHSGRIIHDGELMFWFVLRGEFDLHSDRLGSHQLRENESCVIPAGSEFELNAKAGTEILEVALPAVSTS